MNGTRRAETHNTACFRARGNESPLGHSSTRCRQCGGGLFCCVIVTGCAVVIGIVVICSEWSRKGATPLPVLPLLPRPPLQYSTSPLAHPLRHALQSTSTIDTRLAAAALSNSFARAVFGSLFCPLFAPLSVSESIGHSIYHLPCRRPNPALSPSCKRFLSDRTRFVQCQPLFTSSSRAAASACVLT